MNKFILVLACALSMAACGDGSPESKNGTGRQVVRSEKQNRVELLCFYGKQRCATCRAIEKNTKELVEGQFAEQLKSGTLVFKTIDLSKEANEAIANKYEVAWSSLFLVRYQDGKEDVENLTKYAFANARTAPDAFKEELAKKINGLLN